MIKKAVHWLQDDAILAYFIGIAYLNGILNFLHLYPSKRLLNLGLQSLIVIGVGLVVCLCQKKFVLRYLNVSAVTLGLLAIVILIQPWVNHLLYPDALVFTVGAVLFAVLLSLTVFNLENKKRFIQILAGFVIFGGLAELFTQYAHLFHWTYFYDVLVVPIEKGARPVGNINQPNQAAFIYALAISAVIYLSDCVSKFYVVDNKKLSLLIGLLSLLGVFVLSSGIAVSASRGGLILGVASIGCYFLFKLGGYFVNFKKSAVYFLLGVLGYQLGGYLLSTYHTIPTAIERIALEDHPLRWYQQQQAWLIFKQNPIFGIGWEKFATSTVDLFERLPWVSMTDHSHFIVSQIAAELGVLGLLLFIPLLVIVIKKLRLQMQIEQAFVFTVLALIGLYSFSEYPLWYFSFFMLFVVFLALIDFSTKELIYDLKKPAIVLVVLSMLASGYYYQQFERYAKVFNTTALSDASQEEKLRLVSSLNTPFGFLEYKEYMLYSYLPVSDNHLAAKIAMGDRVSALYPSSTFLMKQGLLYALDNQSDQTLKYFKMACLSEFGSQCDEVRSYLYEASQEQPTIFGQILQDFDDWRNGIHN